MGTFDNMITFDFADAEVDLDASTGDAYAWQPTRGYLVVGATVVYSEATDAAIATKGVVALKYTASGGSAVEKEVSKDIGEEEDMSITQFTCRDGDTVTFNHKTQQTSMEAGKVKMRLHMYAIPDGTI